MPCYVVYLDQVLVGSMAMNLVILWVTAKLGSYQVKKWRLFTSAAVGSFYSLVLFVPMLNFLTHPGYKFLISLGMVAMAFVPVASKKLLLLLAYFYLVTFALGGTVLGLANYWQTNLSDQLLFNVGQGVNHYFWQGALPALIIFWLAGYVVPALIKKRTRWVKLHSHLDIYWQQHHTGVGAFLDTGNNLTDPITGYPVIVLEYQCAKKILPTTVCQAIEEHGLKNCTAVMEAVGEQVAKCHLRMIPYLAVGQSNGWLIGFRPDQVVIKQNDVLVKTSQVVVAISPGKLHLHPHCQAILPLDLLETG